MLSHEAGGGQVYNERPGYLRVERPIIALKGLHLRDAGLLEAAGEEPVSPGSQFVLYQQLQEFRIGQVVMDGLLVARWQDGGHA
jgi:hypothetical protein